MTATLRAGIYGRQSRGKEKSIEEQVALGTTDAVNQGWTVTHKYRDRTSASRYRRKDREEWSRVVAAVAAHEFDVLVLWVSSRGDRDLTSWSALLDACRSQGVLIHIVDDQRTYDVRRGGDWAALAQQGVSNATDSDKISAAVRRGQAGAAASGKPAHGRCPFGYRRTYDPATGALIGQEADPVTAPVVREIIERAAKGDPISRITDDLNERKVPTVGAVKWYRARVRDVATNVAYIGQREYNGQLYDGTWPALVDPAVFYAAQRVLSEPSRVTTRPGRACHLLSYIGTCGPCGAPLTAVRGKYRCLDNGCVTMVQADADDLVTEAVLDAVRDPAVYMHLRQIGEETDRDVMAARAELDELRAELDRWRRSAIEGATSPESLAVIEAGLAAKIQRAERRTRAAIPPALRGLVEPEADVRARWEAMPLAARRDAVRALVTVAIRPSGRPGGRQNGVPEYDRVDVQWR